MQSLKKTAPIFLEIFLIIPVFYYLSEIVYDVITLLVCIVQKREYRSLKWKKIFQKGKLHSSLLWEGLQISCLYFFYFIGTLEWIHAQKQKLSKTAPIVKLAQKANCSLLTNILFSWLPEQEWTNFKYKKFRSNCKNYTKYVKKKWRSNMCALWKLVRLATNFRHLKSHRECQGSQAEYNHWKEKRLFPKWNRLLWERKKLT